MDSPSTELKSRSPARIWATINGVRQRLLSGDSYLIGGWGERKEDRAVEYVRADTCAQMDRDIGILLAGIDGLLEAYGDDRDPEDAVIIEQIRQDWNRRSNEKDHPPHE